jgi:polyphenol oxidase
MPRLTLQPLERVELPEGTLLLRSPALARLGVPHAFTTRLAFGRRDFGLERLSPAERERLPRWLGLAPGTALAWAKQVHGRTALEVGAGTWDPSIEADALWSRRPDRVLMVYSADCVPLLVASPDGLQVAAIHAGWRGLLAGVIQSALGPWAEGGSAAIGPCLGLEAAEMGPEVIAGFEAAELGAAIVARPGQKSRVDVRLAAQLLLERAGLRHVDCSDQCTYRDAHELYSYRRDVTRGGATSTGRLFALAAARPVR